MDPISQELNLTNSEITTFSIITTALQSQNPNSMLGSPPSSGSSSAGVSSPTTLSRYENQKRRDWNTFRKYLRNHRPPLSLSRCSGAHVLEFLRYLDQFGKTKVHTQLCPFYGPLRACLGDLLPHPPCLHNCSKSNCNPPNLPTPFSVQTTDAFPCCCYYSLGCVFLLISQFNLFSFFFVRKREIIREFCFLIILFPCNEVKAITF